MSDMTPERLTQWREDSTPPDVWQDRRIVALIDALESARDERDSLRFELDGFRGVARRDNEHLIARAERAEAKLAKVRELRDALYRSDSLTGPFIAASIDDALGELDKEKP